MTELIPIDKLFVLLSSSEIFGYRTSLVALIVFAGRFDEYWGEFTEFKRTDFQLE